MRKKIASIQQLEVLVNMKQGLGENFQDHQPNHVTSGTRLRRVSCEKTSYKDIPHLHPNKYTAIVIRAGCCGESSISLKETFSPDQDASEGTSTSNHIIVTLKTSDGCASAILTSKNYVLVICVHLPLRIGHNAKCKSKMDEMLLKIKRVEFKKAVRMCGVVREGGGGVVYI